MTDSDDAAWLAREEQLRPRVRLVDDLPLPPRTIGGFDVAYAGDEAFGALVLLDAATLAPLDVRELRLPVGPPYAPGFLARREFPVLEALWAMAARKPDVLFIDGAGVMHPRRMGSATFAGAALDVPTIGITKSPYIGRVGPRTSGMAEVREGDDLLGYALWPAAPGKPVFVSAGHRVSQETARAVAFHARARGQRLPEPIRAADAAANALRARASAAVPRAPPPAVRRVAPATTRELRRRVLRPHLRAQEMQPTPFEDDPRAAHFAAYDGARLVACASVLPDMDARGFWRIRGVATEPDARGRGFGAAVVRACVQHAREAGAPGIWLNGRVGVIPFYQRLGFHVEGEPFDTPPSGLHVRMAAPL